jgi:hypothetical protein
LNWQNFIRGLTLCTLIFGAALLLLTFTTSPERGPITIGLYFVSLFLFILGLSAISGFYVRRWWFHNEIIFENVKISIRQSVLFSAFIASLLALSSMRLLTWWDGVILGISFLLIELYFKTRS